MNPLTQGLEVMSISEFPFRWFDLIRKNEYKVNTIPIEFNAKTYPRGIRNWCSGEEIRAINHHNNFCFSSNVSASEGNCINNINNKINTSTNNKETKVANTDKTQSKYVSLCKYNKWNDAFIEQMKKTDTLQHKFQEIRKMYLNSVKDAEHAKGRYEKELKACSEYSITKFAKDLVEVKDNFSRAFDILKDIELTEAKEEDKTYKSFITGIKLVDKSWSKIFRKYGIAEYKPWSSEKFDPVKHEAIYEYHDNNQDNGTIGTVLYSGFTIGDKVLRPAKVGVVKNGIKH